MLKKAFLSLCICTAFATGLVNAQDTDPNMGIIPAPVSVKKASGEFILSQETTIRADSLNNKAVLFLTDYLQNKAMLHVQLKANTGASTPNTIVLTSAGTDGLPAEGYRLTITPQQVIIAGKGAGLFYGIQTLIQLIPAERTAVAKLPALQIEDYPRFGYRGMMLDVSRHFFSVEFVKKYIDLMAAYKLNNFHWHLTDDQGWRIEIKKYPKLTQVSSQRAQTVIGNYHDRTPQQFDNTPYGGYYTQDQIREVVKYAAERYINIVPEIEMPGHSEAVLAAYPELGCDPSLPYKVAETWGVFHNIYSPSDQTFNFLQDVLTEVMALFPGKYIHVGGDEVPKDAWKKSPFCQQLIKKLKLDKGGDKESPEDKLQSYFIQRIEKFVNSKGRSIIGWDEILEGGLSPNATVMSWRGEAGGIAAAQQSHNVVMTPGSGGLYIDQQQGKSNLEPLSIGGFDPLSRIYSYNPTPAVLTADQQKFILGVQANLWTEYIPTENKADYMILPRLFALAEVAWTPLANKNYTNFANERVPAQLALLDKKPFNYRVPETIGVKDTIIFGNQLVVNLKPSVKGAKVYYTIDGYKPDATGIEYTMPMTYNVPADQYRELKTVVITQTGKVGQATRQVVYNKTALPATNYTGTAKGLKYQLFTGEFTTLAQLKSAAVIDTGIAPSFSTSVFKKNMKGFGVIYSGFIRIDSDGLYGFSVASANGSSLAIDDIPVIDNDGKHSVYDQGGAVPLLKGYHKITIKYFDAGSAGTLKVFMTNPDKPKAELSADILFN
ncbi:family 20 glycosylhydrolase [Mucilaginibacter sp.]|uniref:family 20 glycosylhydrolase n=1 Tax=Mucilaginibacter sp. TaxID=1882438 RepID=UPI003D0ACF35